MLARGLLARNLLARTVVSNVRSLWTGVPLLGNQDERRSIRSAPKRDEGAKGEKLAEIDIVGYTKICEFPQVDTSERVFDNQPYKHLPILHIRSTKNNTLFQLTDHEGKALYNRSCGVDGFKKCRKGTNIAAQVTATAFAKHILKMGHRTCRVCINGLGAGRAASFKGLEQAGITIVSITDSTPIFDYPTHRPPAVRRV